MLLGFGAFTGLIVAASISGAALAAGAAVGGDCARPGGALSSAKKQKDKTPRIGTLLLWFNVRSTCGNMDGPSLCSLRFDTQAARKLFRQFGRPYGLGRCAMIWSLIAWYAAWGRIPRVVNWFFAVYGRPAITRCT